MTASGNCSGITLWWKIVEQHLHKMLACQSHRHRPPPKTKRDSFRSCPGTCRAQAGDPPCKVVDGGISSSKTRSSRSMSSQQDGSGPDSSSQDAHARFGRRSRPPQPLAQPLCQPAQNHRIQPDNGVHPQGMMHAGLHPWTPALLVQQIVRFGDSLRQQGQNLELAGLHAGLFIEQGHKHSVQNTQRGDNSVPRVSRVSVRPIFLTLNHQAFLAGIEAYCEC